MAERAHPGIVKRSRGGAAPRRALHSGKKKRRPLSFLPGNSIPRSASGASHFGTSQQDAQVGKAGGRRPGREERKGK